MIDEFCSYDGLEYKILDYPINFLMSDFTIPTTGTEDESEDEERVMQQSTLEVSEAYWNILSEDNDNWHDVPTDNTFLSRLYNKE
jgi:hypothetical protein